MRKRKLIEQGFCWAKFIGPTLHVMVRPKIEMPR